MGKVNEIVSLKILSNLTFAEIGKLLGESTNTVKWRYYKAIYALKIKWQLKFGIILAK